MVSASSGAIHVLHVDDEPGFSEMAAEFVERQSERVNVETATEAAEAIERLRANRFDCIVSDYDMPGQNGIEFLETIREEYPDLPFILYTGKGSEEVASEAISADVTDYLQKEAGTSQYEVLANRITNTVDKYRAQNELEVSQRRLNLFFEQSPLGVIRWDENFDLERMNEKAIEILGYDELDLRGRSWEAIVPESDRDAVDEVVSNLLEDEGGYHSVNKNVRKDGERIICEWHNRVVIDDGDVVAIFSQFQDVTDRRERERRFRAIFNNTYSFTGLMDTDGTLLEANETALTFGDLDREVVVGQSIWDSYWFEAHDSARATAKEAVDQARNGELFRDEVRVRGADEDAIIDFSVRPIFDANGDVTLLVPEGREITDLKEREQELQETKATLKSTVSEKERQNQAFEAFLDIVSDASRSFDEQMAELLELGVEFLNLDIGIISNIDPPEYTVEHVVPEDSSIEQGAVLDFSDTFCTLVYDADGPVAFRSPDDGDVKDHPCYQDFGLQAYLGEPLLVDGNRYGTLNFSSSDTRQEPFSDGERAFIGTIAEWVSNELARNDRQAEIHRLHQFHRTVLSNMRETVLLTDDDGQITYVCPNVDYIFGYDDGEVADMGSVEALFGEILVDADELETTGELRNIETSVFDAEGQEHIVLATVIQVNIEEGTRLYSIRDITERKEWERAVEALHDTARELMQVETAEEVAVIVVEAVDDVLDMPANSLHLYDDFEEGLTPVTWTQYVEDLLGELPTISPGEGLAWEVFETGEPQIHRDVSTTPGRLNPETEIRSEIIVPIDDHGVILIGSLEPDVFDGTDVSLAQTLSIHTKTALDRLDREQALDRQRSLLEAQQEAGLDGMLVVGEDRQIVSYNDRFVELWDIPEEIVERGNDAEALNWVSDQLANPDDFHEKVDYLYDHPEESTREEIQLEDGRVFDRYTTPLIGKDGTHYGRLWTFRDITARNEREHKLRALNAVMGEIATSNSIEAICNRTIETSQAVLDFDLSAIDIEDNGYLKKQALSDDTPPEHATEMSIEEGLAGETYRTGESFIIDDLAASEIANPQGPYRSAISVPLGDHGVFQAVSEDENAFDDADLELAELLVANAAQGLDRLESERKQTRERDRLIVSFEAIPEPVVHVEFRDAKPIVQTVNQAFEATFGYDSAQLEGRSLNDVIVPDDRRERAQRIDQETVSNRIVEREVERIAKDGRREFLFRAGILDTNEGPNEGIGIYIDISDQRAREREIERHNERLKEFASIVSHDLRNPLNVAKGQLELAREACDSDHLATAEHAHDRMERLIEDLLTLAREGDRVGDTDSVELAAIIENCWRNVETAEATVVAETNAVIEADRSRIAQLFENLIRNAIEHGGESVTVRVGDIPDGFYIEDDGAGIPDQVRDDLFEMGVSTRPEGTGFGLSIVRQIAEAHGWDVTDTEGSDGGARFEFTNVQSVG